MSKQVPWDVIPDNVGSALPTGTYRLEIESMEETQSRKERYMLKATYRVIEPADHQGMAIFENYAIGNEKDPQADDPKSWEGMAAARWKDVIKKAAVRQAPTVEETCRLAQGQQFIADVTAKEETEGEYKGKVRNDIKKTYRIGEKDAASVAGGRPMAAGVTPFRPGRA